MSGKILLQCEVTESSEIWILTLIVFVGNRGGNDGRCQQESRESENVLHFDMFA